MRKFIRESKFRHIYGQNSPKDQQFEGIIGSNSRVDGTPLAVNRKFIGAVLASSGGGTFTVVSRAKPGRYEKVYRFIQHTSEVTDLCFDPFNPNRIASGSEDGSFIVWWIPEGGLEEDCSEFQCILKGSQRRAVQSCWHTSAKDILFCANVDGVHIFNVETAECIRSIDTGKYTDQIYNMSLNFDSSQFAVVGKDKKVRIFDVYTGEMKKDFQVHEGSKPNRVSWLYNVGAGNFVATTGATKMSERQICIWDIENPSEPVSSENIDNSSPVLNIHYDPDIHLLALFSKGEVSVRIYEVEPTGLFFLVSLYQTQEPQRVGAFSGKLGCNSNLNVMMHFSRLLAKSVEEVDFIVPRRSDQFQEDLYPDTMGEEPAMSAQDFVAGKRSNPKMISLRDFSPSDAVPLMNLSKNVGAGVLGRTNTTVGSAQRPTDMSSGISTGDLTNLKNEISEMRALIAQQKARIDQLEQKL